MKVKNIILSLADLVCVGADAAAMVAPELSGIASILALTSVALKAFSLIKNHETPCSSTGAEGLFLGASAGLSLASYALMSQIDVTVNDNLRIAATACSIVAFSIGCYRGVSYMYSKFCSNIEDEEEREPLMEQLELYSYDERPTSRVVSENEICSELCQCKECSKPCNCEDCTKIHDRVQERKEAAETQSIMDQYFDERKAESFKAA